jgi:hypothetical protein
MPFTNVAVVLISVTLYLSLHIFGEVSIALNVVPVDSCERGRCIDTSTRRDQNAFNPRHFLAALLWQLCSGL